MHIPDTWTTPRLYLRPPAIADAPAIFYGYAQDADVTRYLAWKPHTHIAETKQFLQDCRQARSQGIRFPFVICVQDSNNPIGMVEIRRQQGVNLGYVLAKAYWGNGYVSEVVQVLSDWAIAQDEIHRVWAVCDVENRASARVLEKAGMTCEGRLRHWAMLPNVSDRPRDCFMYSKIS